MGAADRVDHRCTRCKKAKIDNRGCKRCSRIKALSGSGGIGQTSSSLPRPLHKSLDSPHAITVFLGRGAAMATAADASAAASATAGDVSGNPYETDSVRGKGCRQRPDFDVLRTDIIYSTHFIRCCIRHGHWHAALGGARAFQRRFYDRGFGKEVPEEKSVDYWKGHLNNVVARMKQLDLLHMPDQALGATLLLYLHQVEPRLHDEREELAREVEAAAIRTEAILRSARASFEEVLRSQTETARRMSRQAGAAARTAENASKLAAFRDMGLSRLARATKQVAMRVPALLHQGRAGAARRLLEAARADVAA
ncbi:unnamed protein product, partial [Phaeothamnion confervicola]